MEQPRRSNLVWQPTSSASDWHPGVSRPSSRPRTLEAPARISPRMSLTLILLSSLGLWAAIWAVVSSLIARWF
jgi:hypothetical protein